MGVKPIMELGHIRFTKNVNAKTDTIGKEAKAYFVGWIQVDGVNKPIVATSLELKKLLDRADKQPEDVPVLNKHRHSWKCLWGLLD